MAIIRTFPVGCLVTWRGRTRQHIGRVVERVPPYRLPIVPAGLPPAVHHFTAEATRTEASFLVMRVDPAGEPVISLTGKAHLYHPWNTQLRRLYPNYWGAVAADRQLQAWVRPPPRRWPPPLVLVVVAVGLLLIVAGFGGLPWTR